MEEKTKFIIDKLKVLSMAVPGTKLNKQSMEWEQSYGVTRWLRGDSKKDITSMLSKICDDIQEINDVTVFKRHILNALDGIDTITSTYSSDKPFVDTVNKLRRLLEEYLVE